MRTLELKAEKKDTVGKGYNRKVRAQKRIPVVVYGGEANRAFTVSEQEFLLIHHIQRHENVIVNLNCSGAAAVPVIIKDVQTDPVTHKPMHIDFIELVKGRKVNVPVPVELNGLPIGVKDDSGILEHLMHTLNVSCEPSLIPDAIRIDVSALKIGDGIHIRDIKLDGDIKLLDNPDQLIAAVGAPTRVEVATPTAEEAAAAEGAAAEGAAAPAAGDKKAAGGAAAPAGDKKADAAKKPEAKK